MAEEEVLPAKIHSDRSIRDFRDDLSVSINGYELNLQKLVPKVYKYELRFQAHMPEREIKGKTLPEKCRDLWKGDKNDVAARFRNRVNHQLFLKLVESNDLFRKWNPDYKKSFIHGFVYDCATILYSRVSLLEDGEPKTFYLPADTLDNVLTAYVNCKSMDHYVATLSGDEIIDLSNLKTMDENRNRAAVQFLELLYSQYIYQKDSHFVFADKMFLRNSDINLDGREREPRVLKPGLSKSVRIVGDDSRDCRVLIQVEPKKAAFFPGGMPLIEFASAFLQQLNNNAPVDLSRLSPSLSTLLKKQLRGLVLETTHLKNNKKFLCNGVSETGADNVRFDFEGHETSVAQYYAQHHLTNLKYPRYPCAMENTKRKDAQNRPINFYYPFETLVVHDGQRVPLEKQTPKLTEHLIRKSQLKPTEFKELTGTEKGVTLISNDNPYGKSFGVGVGYGMETTAAKVLFPPKIVMGNGEFDLQPVDPSWNVRGKKFIEPATIPIWAVCAIDTGLDNDSMNEFVNNYVRAANGFGIKIGKPGSSDALPRGVEQFEDLFKYYKKHNVQFVLLITGDRVSVDAHNRLKLMEQQFDITTQHICSRVVNDLKKFPNRLLTLQNIIMKTNMKVGGLNWRLATSRTFADKNRTGDLIADQFLHAGRMFFGLDFTHPGPQTRYERNINAPINEPTVVGMACTLGHPLKMHGTYWYQEPRVAHVVNMTEHIVRAINKYRSTAGRWPSSIVVYRNGASEGEFRNSLLEERDAFESAFQKLAPDGLDTKPSLIIVVVQKTNIARLLLNDAKDIRGTKAVEENTFAGTVVDRNLLNPSLTEFLIVAHKAIQGTARPARCTVVHDSHLPRMKLQELEYITYSMCYTHGIVSSPISVPGPLYSAGDLAKRGRNNLRAAREHETFNNRNSQNPSTNYERENNEDDTFFDRVTSRLDAVLQHKFWA